MVRLLGCWVVGLMDCRIMDSTGNCLYDPVCIIYPWKSFQDIMKITPRAVLVTENAGSVEGCCVC